ncbi:Uncharacterised protein [Mycobacteroides abscessus subsp. abscessus]|uniref:hypothetical protein n=1 Tax=Mycobacteroides abscessus TaxID=36809 RepID=UPI0009274E67|nr:hypothetical protein [Mycobacteroides abscessus]SHU69830.1 Uncharacterised protein [Mycobacteroides abscessus subsp. abscessus]
MTENSPYEYRIPEKKNTPVSAYTLLYCGPGKAWEPNQFIAYTEADRVKAEEKVAQYGGTIRPLESG